MTFDPSLFINEKIKVMPPSGIRKFFDIVSTMEGAISLGVGEPDFVTPWSVRDAGIYSLEKGKTHYTSNSGMMELREEICNYLKRRFDLTYNYKETLVTVGGSEAIAVAMKTLLNPGDEVLVPEPSFVCYKPCAIIAGGTPIPVKTTADNSFKLTKEDVLKHLTPKTKLLVLS